MPESSDSREHLLQQAPVTPFEKLRRRMRRSHEADANSADIIINIPHDQRINGWFFNGTPEDVEHARSIAFKAMQQMVEERGRPARFYAAYNNHPLHPRNLITYLEPGMTPEERVRRMREYTRAVGELLASDQNVSSAWLLGSLARMEKYPFDADITIITNSLHHKSPRASFKTENVVIEPIEPHMKSGEFLEEDTCQRIDRLAKEYGTYTDINLLTQNQFDKNILEFQDSIRSEGIQLCPNTER